MTDHKQILRDALIKSRQQPIFATEILEGAIIRYLKEIDGGR